mgnify:CR=1 FL=1
MAHLVLQDEVHGVAVQFRVAGKNILGPLGVLLQFFRVLAHRGAGYQCIGQLKQFLFRRLGSTARPMDLDQAVCFLLM